MTFPANSLMKSTDRSFHARKPLGLPVAHELSHEEIAVIGGGFFWGCVWVKPLFEGGEECNNGICVPYQEEGDY
jgi:hypothetical protein